MKRRILGTIATLLVAVMIAGCGSGKPSDTTPTAGPANTDSAYTDYLMVYFTGNGRGQEQIYFAISEDGLNWKNTNGGQAVLKSNVGECGVRDPYIFRTQEGKFIIIATDLCIASNGDWWRAQSAGSKCIVIWESDDLVNWSEPRLVKVNSDDAGCTWAPEAFYDEEHGDYIVFWASRVASKNFDYQRIYYVRTKDFVTFTEPEVWIDKGTDTIDTTILKVDGHYYRFTKYEGTSRVILEDSDSLFGEWLQVYSAAYLSKTSGIEGPFAYALSEEDVVGDYKWILVADAYGGSGYYSIGITDLDRGSMKKITSSMPTPIARHGAVLNITHEEYQKIYDKWVAK